jgi:hypothetical protein
MNLSEISKSILTFKLAKKITSKPKWWQFRKKRRQEKEISHAVKLHYILTAIDVELDKIIKKSNGY